MPWPLTRSRAILATGCLTVLASSAHAQVRVTGTVVDSEGHAPVPAATVTITGTTLGTQTSDSGKFAIRVPSDAKSLTVRRIGFRQAVVAINPDQSDYTVVLSKDVLRLEQQVVTGLATTINSRNAANDVAVLDSTEINRMPAPTIENSIQGKVPGAIIEQNNGGAPGGGMQIQIRGVTSLFSEASPLYVIDGVIADNETINNGLNALDQGISGSDVSAQDNSPNRIADLNPNDIESIEVLKGSSASAIYGSKAASGVVLITTKKGSPGKAKWDLTQRLGTSFEGATLNLRTFPTLASAQAWAAAYTSYSPGLIDSTYTGSHDFQNELFGGGGLAYETDVSVRGATEHSGTNYYVSGMTKYDPGIMLNTGYNKQTVRTNITQNVSSALSVTANLSYAHSLTRRGFTGNDNISGSPYDVFSYTPTFFNMDAKYADGAYILNPFGPANVFQDAYGIQTPEETNRFIGGGTVSLKVFQTEKQSLMLSAVGGADELSQRDQVYASPDLYVEAAQSLPGVSTVQNATISFLNYSLNAVHHYTGLSQLDLTTSIGLEREKRDVFNPNGVGQFLLAGPTTPTVGSIQTLYYRQSAERDLSFYGQEQVLMLDQRLSLTAGLTGARSTNDGNIDKFFLYPKYAASIRVPTGGVPGLDELKLRVAYGRSGTLPLYGVRTTSLVTGVDAGLSGVSGAELLGDSAIRPETNTEIETGFDATMLKSRLEFNATVYQKRITDLLLQANISPASGANQQWINGGQFTNQGIELSVAVTPIQMGNGLTWISRTSFYRNYSRVDALPVPAFDPSLGSGYGDYGGVYGAYQVQVGRSVTQWVGPVLERNGQMINEQIGDVQPAFQMSFGNEFTLGRFRLYGLIDWKHGGEVSNNTNSYYDHTFLLADTVFALRRAQFQQLGAACIREANGGLSCAYIEDAGYVKAREITLSYDLPGYVVRTVGFGRLTNARLSVSGRNLFWWYKYSGLDPEVSFTGNQQVGRGNDLTPYPPARYVYVSVDIGF